MNVEMEIGNFLWLLENLRMPTTIREFVLWPIHPSEIAIIILDTIFIIELADEFDLITSVWCSEDFLIQHQF